MRKEKVVRLKGKEVKYLESMINNLDKVYDLTYEQQGWLLQLYKVMLRVKYLALVMEKWDLRDTRLVNIKREVERLRRELNIVGLDSDYWELSNKGLKCTLLLRRNKSGVVATIGKGQKLNLQISDVDFEVIKKGEF